MTARSGPPTRAAASCASTPSGGQTLIAQQPVAGVGTDADTAPERRLMGGTLPNGIAFDRHGDIVIAISAPTPSS